MTAVHYKTVPSAKLAVPTAPASDKSGGMDSLVKLLEQMRVEFAQLETSLDTIDNRGPPNRNPATGSNNIPHGNQINNLPPRLCPYDSCNRTKATCEALAIDMTANKVKAFTTRRLMYPDNTMIPFIAGQMINLLRAWKPTTTTTEAAVIGGGHWIGPAAGRDGQD